jgi:plastocyanin
MRINRAHRLTMILCVPFMAAALAFVGCDDNNNNGGTGGAGGQGGLGGTAGGGGAGGVGGTGGSAADAGTSSDGSTSASALEITIQNFSYSPVDLTVPAGSTVTVHNADSVGHTLTSESAPMAFTAGAVAGVSFDTGIIAPGATATFTIPATAPSGTVIPYFCAVHLQAMGEGQITVQ